MSVEKRVGAYLELATKEHRLEELFKRFGEGDPWPGRLHALATYSAYATAFRYPTPGGRILSDPLADTIRRDLKTIRELIATARTELLTST
jgi:hypothetical protein